MASSEALGAALTVAALTLATALLVGPPLWALADLSRTPDAVWDAAGRKKRKWAVAFVVGIWAWFVGLPAVAVYVRKVRPELARTAAALGVAAEPRTARSKRVWALAGTVVAGIVVAGTWAYVTHAHVQFSDPSLARDANAVCEEAKSELAERPPLPEAPTFEERAERVERALPVFEGMISELRDLSPAGSDAAYDRWIDVWRDYAGLVPAYADAVRTGDPSIYRPAGDADDEPASEVNAIARSNGMDACVF